MQQTQKNVKSGRKKKISSIKHTKYISYLEARRIFESSQNASTYANIARMTNNSIQKQETTQNNLSDLVEELRSLTEILKKNLISSTTRSDMNRI